MLSRVVCWCNYGVVVLYNICYCWFLFMYCMSSVSLCCSDSFYTTMLHRKPLRRKSSDTLNLQERPNSETGVQRSIQGFVLPLMRDLGISGLSLHQATKEVARVEKWSSQWLWLKRIYPTWSLKGDCTNTMVGGSGTPGSTAEPTRTVAGIVTKL